MGKLKIKKDCLWKLEAQVGQKSLTWIRLIKICYIVPWCHLGYQILDCLYFFITFLGPFRECFTHIELIVHQRWAKTRKLREKQPDHLLPEHGFHTFAILNLHVPIKFLNSSIRLRTQMMMLVQSGGCCVPGSARGTFYPWISEGINFSNFQSQYRPDAFHQDSAQSNLQFGKIHLKNSNMATITCTMMMYGETFYGRHNFLTNLVRLSCYKRKANNIDVISQSGCLAVDQIMIDLFA